MTIDKEGPILIFDTIEEMMDTAKTWKHNLFLDHWYVALGFFEQHVYPEHQGHASFNIENCDATITLLAPSQARNAQGIMKFCHEKILIHELLHLKYAWTKAPDSMEGVYFETLEHQLIEQMAMTLLMTKYNLTSEWFMNAPNMI